MKYVLKSYGLEVQKTSGDVAIISLLTYKTQSIYEKQAINMEKLGELLIAVRIFPLKAIINSSYLYEQPPPTRCGKFWHVLMETIV